MRIWHVGYYDENKCYQTRSVSAEKMTIAVALFEREFPQYDPIFCEVKEP